MAKLKDKFEIKLTSKRIYKVITGLKTYYSTLAAGVPEQKGLDVEYAGGGYVSPRTDVVMQSKEGLISINKKSVVNAASSEIEKLKSEWKPEMIVSRVRDKILRTFLNILLIVFSIFAAVAYFGKDIDLQNLLFGQVTLPICYLLQLLILLLTSKKTTNLVSVYSLGQYIGINHFLYGGLNIGTIFAVIAIFMIIFMDQIRNTFTVFNRRK